MELETDSEQGQQGLAPMVFFCSSCRSILSDSNQFLASHREEQVISVRGEPPMKATGSLELSCS